MSRVRVACVLMLLTTALIYLPVLHHEFLNYDDGQYVTQNPTVQAGPTWNGIEWAFTTMHMSNWHPLTWLSHMLDCRLFGSNPAGHHMVNVLLHSINAVLVFLLWFRMTGAFWRSAIVAALFAWHPQRVESVAWIAERKDVLSAFFGLLTLLAYARYAKGPKSKVRSPKSKQSVMDFGSWTLDYCLALGFFVLGLLSKPMLVTLPFVLLLLDYWPLNRVSGGLADWKRLVKEKWPFFVLSAGSCLMTFIAQQRGGSVVAFDRLSPEWRIEIAATAYVRYLLKAIWPVNLAVLYPLPTRQPVAEALGAVALLAAISYAAWRTRRRYPFFLTGWLWYLGMLVPVIGLVQVGQQSMADRYTYWPMMGIGVSTVFLCGAWAASWNAGPGIVGVTTAVVLGAVLCLTSWQLQFWKDSATLFNRALVATSDNYVAHNNIGTVYMEDKKWDDAIPHFRAALAMQQRYPNAWYNLGVCYLEQGKSDEAIVCLHNLVELMPAMAAGHNNLGNALLRERRWDEAIVEFKKALAIQPTDVQALNNLGGALMELRHYDEAIAALQRALELQPGYSQARSTLGTALLRKGDLADAQAAFERALRDGPDNANTRYQLAVCYLRLGRLKDAVQSMEKGLACDPKNVQLENDLAWILATCPDPTLRNGPHAVELAEHACRDAGNSNGPMLSTLAAAYAETGDFTKATVLAEKALEVAAVGDSVRVRSLKAQIDAYRSGLAFRDTNLPAPR